MLGPPKTSFSSASARNAAKLAGLGLGGEGQSGKERITETPFRSTDDADDEDRRRSRYNGITSRRLGREDHEEWQAERRRRNFGQEDGDGRPRRPGERDRDRSRWDREAKDNPEEQEDGGRRRDGQGRAKFEQPWFRNDKEKAQETDPRNGKTDWRSDRGGRREDKYRDRYGKEEQDPEWMDSGDVHGQKQAHTQEDFQKWKEQMKAGGDAADEKVVAPAEEERPSLPSFFQTEPMAAAVQAKPKSAMLSAPEIDAAMDKFLANFGEKEGAETKAIETKAPRKGRFAALFSPPPEEPVKEMPVAQAPPETQEPRVSNPLAGMNDADQAGFQRILQMLGQRSQNGTPQEQVTKSRNPAASIDPATKTSQQGHPPPVDPFAFQVTGTRRASPPTGRNSAGLESAMRPRSPGREQIPRPISSSNDADLLLRLMRQSQANSQPPQPSQPDERVHTSTRPAPQGVQPGLIEAVARESRERSMRPNLAERLPGFDQHRNEQHAQQAMLQRRPTNGQPPSFFDEPYLHELRQNNQPQPMALPEQYRQQGRPSGMQRPPGFEQPSQAPPGWPEHVQAPARHVQPQGQMAFPPGMPNSQQRGMNPSYSSSQQLPRQMPMGMPPPQQLPQQQRQRKYTGEGGSSFPPGMSLPPGFMTNESPTAFMANGPPPGFPTMPQGRNIGGVQYDGGRDMSRHLMDLYASGQRNPGRGPGGGGMLGGYQ